MATLISGNRNQEWMDRTAQIRKDLRFTRALVFVTFTILAFSVAGNVYEASLPREKAVIVAEQRDGSYVPYAENASPDELGKRKLISDWFASFPLAQSDLSSFAARQTAALMFAGSDAGKELQSYYQSVAASGMTVTGVTVHLVTSSGPYDYAVDWDETVTDPNAQTKMQKAMRGYVTIGFADSQADLHSDSLLNPYGLYIKTLRIMEVGK